MEDRIIIIEKFKPEQELDGLCINFEGHYHPKCVHYYENGSIKFNDIEIDPSKRTEYYEFRDAVIELKKGE